MNVVIKEDKNMTGIKVVFIGALIVMVLLLAKFGHTKTMEAQPKSLDSVSVMEAQHDIERARDQAEAERLRGIWMAKACDGLVKKYGEGARVHCAK